MSFIFNICECETMYLFLTVYRETGCTEPSFLNNSNHINNKYE